MERRTPPIVGTSDALVLDTVVSRRCPKNFLSCSGHFRSRLAFQFTFAPPVWLINPNFFASHAPLTTFSNPGRAQIKSPDAARLVRPVWAYLGRRARRIKKKKKEERAVVSCASLSPFGTPPRDAAPTLFGWFHFMHFPNGFLVTPELHLDFFEAA